MAEICRFHGIVIGMFFKEHPPPHFHASYGANRLRVDIATGRILSGSFQPRERRLVLRWWRLHRTELSVNWSRAAAGLPLQRIEPLG